MYESGEYSDFFILVKIPFDSVCVDGWMNEWEKSFCKKLFHFLSDSSIFLFAWKMDISGLLILSIFFPDLK